MCRRDVVGAGVCNMVGVCGVGSGVGGSPPSASLASVLYSSRPPTPVYSVQQTFNSVTSHNKYFELCLK